MGRQGVDIKQFSQGRPGVLGTPGYPRHCLFDRLPALDLFHPQRVKRSIPHSLLPFLVVHSFVHPGNELRKPLDDLNDPVIFLTNGMKSNTLQTLARHLQAFFWLTRRCSVTVTKSWPSRPGSSGEGSPQSDLVISQEEFAYPWENFPGDSAWWPLLCPPTLERGAM